MLYALSTELTLLELLNACQPARAIEAVALRCALTSCVIAKPQIPQNENCVFTLL